MSQSTGILKTCMPFHAVLQYYRAELSHGRDFGVCCQGLKCKRLLKAREMYTVHHLNLAVEGQKRC